MAKETQGTTVNLSVGGQCFVVARGTIERYPDSMLANLVSRRWQQESSNDDQPLFIDRDGHRFRYVLDWMRDGEVHLPVTESYEAFRRELDYYGFSDVSDDSIIAGTLKGGQILTAVSSNVYDENDTMETEIIAYEAKINELRYHQKSNTTAHGLLVRCTNAKEGDIVTVTLKNQDDMRRAFDAITYDLDYFKGRLAGYGLKLHKIPSRDFLVMSSPSPRFSTDPYHFELERIQEKKRKTDERGERTESKKARFG